MIIPTAMMDSWNLGSWEDFDGLLECLRISQAITERKNVARLATRRYVFLGGEPRGGSLITEHFDTHTFKPIMLQEQKVAFLNTKKRRGANQV